MFTSAASQAPDPEDGRRAVREVARHLYDPAGGVIAQFEFGAGAIEIEEGWESTTHGKVSEWGHHPPQLLTKAYRRAKEAREKKG